MRRQRCHTECAADAYGDGSGSNAAGGAALDGAATATTRRIRYHTISDPHDTRHIDDEAPPAQGKPPHGEGDGDDASGHARRMRPRSRTDTYQRWLRQQRVEVEKSNSPVVLLCNLRAGCHAEVCAELAMWGTIFQRETVVSVYLTFNSTQVERQIRERLGDALLRASLSSDCTFGFLELRSAEDAIAAVENLHSTLVCCDVVRALNL